MEKYAVAFISFFDSELKLSFVEATDILHAIEVAGYLVYVKEESSYELEELKQIFFDQDAAIDVQKLP